MEAVLVHHGVKGQKWGVRRYQNEDGTRTSLGRKHVGYETVRGPYDGSSHETAKKLRISNNALSDYKRNNPNKEKTANTITKYGKSAITLAAGGAERLKILKEGLDTDSAKKLLKNVAIVGLTLGSAVLISKGSRFASKALGEISKYAFKELSNPSYAPSLVNPNIKKKLIANGAKYASKAIAGFGMYKAGKKTKDAIARGVGTAYGATYSISDKVTGSNGKQRMNEAVDKAMDSADMEKILAELKKDGFI